MANRGTTIRKKNNSEMATYNVAPANFWEIGNYSRTVKRINETNLFCDDLVKMFTERADIESKYSKRLTEWHEKWTKILETSPMYATMKTAALGTLKEAKDRSIIHMDCWSKIHNQTVETIKRFKESNYHKAFVGLKEAKDFDEEFSKAQKPWAVAFGKVQRAKKNYHSACKQREVASQHFSVANKDSEIPMEKVKKLEEAVKKSENNVAAMKKKYEEKLFRIEPLNKTYEDEMRNVYTRWEREEVKRKDFMQQTLVDFHKAVNICDDHRFKECFDNQLNVAYSGKTSYDIQWYSENYGVEMPRNWPKFEELGSVPELPHQVSIVEPPPSQNYQTQVSYQQQQSTNSYQATTDPVSNPFTNGPGSKDGFDEDEDWDDPPPIPVPGGGIPVRALYDYNKVEDDELSFKAGDILTKLTEEDQQGWCRGTLNGVEGLYPANYVEAI